MGSEYPKPRYRVDTELIFNDVKIILICEQHNNRDKTSRMCHFVSVEFYMTNNKKKKRGSRV